jgi:beta-galactosidase
MANRDYDRLEAASVLVSFPGDFLETPAGFSEYPNFMTVSEDPLGFAEPIQVAKAEWFADCYRGLSECGLAFLLSDTALGRERWQHFKAIVLSAFEYLDGRIQRDLLEFARAGGAVVIGPRLPILDALMHPDSTLEQALRRADSQPLVVDGRTVGRTYGVGSGRIVHLTDLANAGQALDAALTGMGVVRFTRNDARLDVAIHQTGDASRTIVFVANPTPDRIEGTVGLENGIASAREVWEEREVDVRNGVINDVLEPYQIRIYELVGGKD